MAIKIIEKSYAKIVPFYELELGAAFVIKKGDVSYDNGDRHMKVTSNDGVICLYNAVNLTNGFSLEKIDSDTDVAEIRAELILEDNDY